MELHPILDSWPPSTSLLTPNLWYVVSPTAAAATAANGNDNATYNDAGASSASSSPSARVGATMTFDRKRGVVFVVGGADPSGAHGDVFELKLNGDFDWRKIDSKGKFKPRYEHATYCPTSFPSLLFVFGGADANGNSNSIQVFDAASYTWSSPSVSGAAPSPRTYHVGGSACHEDKFYVFSGGEAGSQPVGDRQLHCFDAASVTWNSLPARGTPPKPRHGHSLVVIGGKLVVFGGMAGHSFYNDLSLYDLTSNEWTTFKAPKNGCWPSPRAAHGAAVIDDDKMVVFGGMSGQGALDDLWILTASTCKWRRVETQGPPPASRLDFALTVVEIPPSAPVDADATSAPNDETSNVINESSAQPTTTNSAALPAPSALSTVAPSGQSEAHSLSSASPSSSSHAPQQQKQHAFETIIAADGATSSDFALITEDEKNKEKDGQEMEEGRRSDVDDSDRALVSETEAKLGLNNSSVQDNSGDVSTSIRTSDVAPNSSTLSSASSLSTSSSALLIFGGMDTEGEIYDDCLLIKL